MAKTGQRSNAGQEICLADIEADADAGAGMGLFETIHNQLSPASMALSLKKYSSRISRGGGHGMVATRAKLFKQHSSDLSHGWLLLE